MLRSTQIVQSCGANLGSFLRNDWNSRNKNKKENFSKVFFLSNVELSLWTRITDLQLVLLLGIEFDKGGHFDWMNVLEVLAFQDSVAKSQRNLLLYWFSKTQRFWLCLVWKICVSRFGTIWVWSSVSVNTSFTSQIFQPIRSIMSGTARNILLMKCLL